MSRRSLLKTGLAVTGVSVLVPGAAAVTDPPVATATPDPDLRRSVTPDPDVARGLRELEQRYAARVGVYARNVRTGETVRYRSGERFAMCSTFKGLLAAHVMRDYDHNGEYLERVLHYTEDDLVDWSVVTEHYVGIGMAVRDLCMAATSHSDNAATNVLLRATDGPRGFTRFCRSLGDAYTRLDRYEPDMSEGVPGDVRDTTTPEAIGRDYARLVLGDALKPFHRDQLVSWLKVNTTSGPRFRAGLPDDWVLGDKTGNGGYGTVNDIGIVWTPKGTTLVLSVMSTSEVEGVPADNGLIADTARLLAHTLAPGE
ncbi:class A beta-lactamase [Actinopolymorpha pittospori]|uniref:class A beta-lactamase n=1 Tax=Actinopolymorpha pittospori TaxID=648752 RepID=UPI0031EC98A8